MAISASPSWPLVVHIIGISTFQPYSVYIITTSSP
jgi:hypothetical protein